VSSYLSLRSSASTQASTLIKIPKNVLLTVLQVHTTTSWLKVTYSSKTGYVLSHYVVIGGSTSYRAGTVTTSQLNVRSGTGTSYSVLGKLKSGNTVVITKNISVGGITWYRIVYGTKTGYIDSRYVRKSAS
jgi:uncharacterized protein YgiM (DUF1202 family)